jgi:hypothetical protein
MFCQYRAIYSNILLINQIQSIANLFNRFDREAKYFILYLIDVTLCFD